MQSFNMASICCSPYKKRKFIQMSYNQRTIRTTNVGWGIKRNRRKATQASDGRKQKGEEEEEIVVLVVVVAVLVSIDTTNYGVAYGWVNNQHLRQLFTRRETHTRIQQCRVAVSSNICSYRYCTTPRDCIEKPRESQLQNQVQRERERDPLFYRVYFYLLFHFYLPFGFLLYRRLSVPLALLLHSFVRSLSGCSDSVKL